MINTSKQHRPTVYHGVVEWCFLKNWLDLCCTQMKNLIIQNTSTFSDFQPTLLRLNTIRCDEKVLSLWFDSRRNEAIRSLICTYRECFSHSCLLCTVSIYISGRICWLYGRRDKRLSDTSLFCQNKSHSLSTDKTISVICTLMSPYYSHKHR